MGVGKQTARHRSEGLFDMSDNTDTKVQVTAYRVAHAELFKALRAVAVLARMHGDAGADTTERYRAFVKQSYRPAGSVVRWAKPEHRTVHGKSTPDNGSTMGEFLDGIGALVAELPKGKAGSDEAKAHTAATKSIAALRKVLS
jgi:hypothetical protein